MRRMAALGVEADIVDAVITGSRARGIEKEDSDLDVVIEYRGNMREDALCNALNDGSYSVCGIKVDINPIRMEESGTLAGYLPMAEAYLSEKPGYRQP